MRVGLCLALHGLWLDKHYERESFPFRRLPCIQKKAQVAMQTRVLCPDDNIDQPLRLDVRSFPPPHRRRWTATGNRTPNSAYSFMSTET